MVDVEERLRGLKDSPAPDLWPDIERRSPSGKPSVRWSRFAVAAAALAVAAAGVSLAVRAFVSREDNRPSAVPGGSIAYVVSGEYQPGRNNSQILVRTQDGSVRKLVDGWAPAWSPDGSQIAYVSETPSETHLSVIDVDGTDARILVRFSRRDPAGSPAWSPDGQWIAYQTGEGIFMIGPEGGAARQVTQPPTETPRGPARCWDGEPSWSPDGQTIVFTVYCAQLPSRAGTDLGLWTVRVDGTDRRQLLPTPSERDHVTYQNPEWSPDGRHIAFVIQGARLDPRISVMDADGSNVRRFALGITPAWSPDSTLIAFTSIDANGPLSGPLQLMTLGGSIVRTLTPEPTLAGDGKQYCCPAWASAVEDRARPDVAQLRVTASVAVGSHALDLATGYRAVWVLVDPIDERPRAVRIDPSAGQITGSVRVPPRANRIVIGGGGVWVIRWLAEEPDRLTEIDPASLEVTSDVALADNVGVTVATEEALWVAADVGEAESQTLLRLDSATNDIEWSVPLQGSIEFVDDMAIAGNSLWLLDYRGLARGSTPAQVVRVDAATGAIGAEIPVEGACHGPGGLRIAADPSGAWINCRTGPDSFVARFIDAENNSVGPPVELPAGYSAPFAVSKEGVWFVGYDTSDRGRLFFFDPKAQRIIDEVVLDGLFGEDAAFDSVSGSVWVARAPDHIVRLEFDKTH